VYKYFMLKLHWGVFSTFSALNPITLFVIHWESGLWSSHHQVRQWSFLQESVNLKPVVFNELEWRLLCVLFFKLLTWWHGYLQCVARLHSTLHPEVACGGDSMHMEGSCVHIDWAEFKAVDSWVLVGKLITPCFKERERERDVVGIVTWGPWFFPITWEMES
jgi:hypothetical protein